MCSRVYQCVLGYTSVCLVIPVCIRLTVPAQIGWVNVPMCAGLYQCARLYYCVLDFTTVC